MLSLYRMFHFSWMEGFPLPFPHIQNIYFLYVLLPLWRMKACKILFVRGVCFPDASLLQFSLKRKARLCVLVYTSIHTSTRILFPTIYISDSQYSCGSDYQVPLKTISENSFSSPFFPLPIKDFPHEALTSSQELFWKGGLTAQRLFHWASWHMEKRWLKLQQKPSFPQHHITLLFDPSTWAP